MDTILPMLAKLGSLPQNAADYAYEIKWDGLRAILYYENGQIEIRSRSNKIITTQYPELFSLRNALNVKNIVLDGEIVCLSANGHPSFSELQHRMGLTCAKKISDLMHSYPVTYIIFDVLYLNNKLLTNRPYLKRREILDKLNLSGDNFQTPAYTYGNGDDMLKATRNLGLEGIMAKRLDSLYLPGKRSNDWLKIKNKLRQEFVIGGWLPGQNARTGSIGSLLIGYYALPQQKSAVKAPDFLYAGKVGTGFTTKTLKDLKTLLSALHRDTTPFSNKTPKGAIFVKPTLVGEFEFTEWTPNNTLRHPSFKGLRSDKNAKDVIKENQ
ncbi:MAG: non-homologous end-joining DNA ligase [Pelosinus sp.]|nr:non-homologous end-joining DNA ligase [Pelosinus sp.]